VKAGRALVVDDDPGILEVLEMRLQSMGLDVALARNYREAVRLLDDRGFDVALFDLRMEPTNGLKLMEAAHERQPRLPVLIMTAHGTIDNAVEALRQGAFDYLTKPFVPEELRGKVGRALSQRRWTRDRTLLKAVGEALGSSGTMEQVLDAIAQATVEATEAERAVVFLLEGGRLVPMASAGAKPGSIDRLATRAEAVIERKIPVAVADIDGLVTLGSPLFIGGGAAGALVVETRVEPSADDLDLLALFSSQAAVALKTTRELERLRSGALAALGRMAAQVAHELRNPLAGLKLFAEYLEHRLGDAGDGEGADVAGKISREVDHMTDLVREITQFGRPGSLRRVPTDLNGLLESCLALAQARVEGKENRVVLELDPALPQVALDPREMRKVFLNLIVNALEATDAGGTLTLCTRAAARGFVEASVEDTGCGMSEETRARAFDLFFTTKDNGTGLGMAIARTVVEQHGGRMDIRSQVGRGTQVRVVLPLDAL
jgi:two-component system, OmpR family, phosphate regulon sensor histidine kinase PhoR